jgi:type IV pilus assembly protein PilM
MADGEGVWGIDIGQAGLKAIRLKHAEAADQVIAVAFDYVAHPKILSQPDAIPDELISQALETFLSRNDVKGDKICVSVPGQAALTRFIKLPPVESSKIGSIINYEAQQQIPFPLPEVCWPYQILSGGAEESGYMLDAEVIIVAMKRDQVMQQLQPFIDHQVEVDQIQTSPLALYNFLSYDRLGVRKETESTGSDEHTIVLDMGADNTTLMVSNGEKIWIRNVPIGGNHFTRALTKEMKLTFAKAEHLKINATKSPDPRAVFQALRPVFNDYVSEIQRSIGYFSSVNRTAKIAKVVGLGNGFKLAGLQKFLQQNLQYEVERVDSFQSVVGDSVLNAKLFDENVLSFAVPYGLALQGLEQTRIHIDLLPEEIRTERLIRHKKPWAVAAAATLLCSLAISATGYARMNKSVSTERFGASEEVAKKVTAKAAGYLADYDSEKETYKKQDKIDGQLVRPARGKVLWAELQKAYTECLPHDPKRSPDGTIDPKDIATINRIKIWKFSSEKVPDVSVWYKKIPSSQEPFMREEDRNHAPTGEGYIITLELASYIKTKPGREINYIEESFLKNLRQWSIDIKHPRPETGIPVRQIGITHPIIAQINPIKDIKYVLDRRKLRAGNRVQGTGRNTLQPGPGGENGQPYPPYPMGGETSSGGTGEAGPGGETGTTRRRFTSKPEDGTEKDDNILSVPLTRVTVQFIWQPVPLDKRELFNHLNRYFLEQGKLFKLLEAFSKTNPEGNFEAASKYVAKIQEAAKGLQLTEDRFNNYKAKNYGDYNSAETYINKLQKQASALKLSQELFDEFAKKHYAPAAPKEEEEASDE